MVGAGLLVGEPVEGVAEQALDVDHGVGDLALGHVEDLGLGPVDRLGDVVGQLVRRLCDLTRDADQAAQQRQLFDDLGVVGGVGNQVQEYLGQALAIGVNPVRNPFIDAGNEKLSGCSCKSSAQGFHLFHQIRKVTQAFGVDAKLALLQQREVEVLIGQMANHSCR